MPYEPETHSDKPFNKTISEVCSSILKEIGEDPKRVGLIKTPQRFAKAILELTEGYTQDVRKIVNGAIFEEKYSEMVIIKHIEFYSLCEHHLLPFFGHAHVAYIPNGRIIGLSKIPRIVNVFSRRLQVQERLTEQIADTLHELLAPVGVACMVEAYHMCMMMRGIQVQSSMMITNAMRGIFLENPATRSEFLNIIRSDAKR